MTRRKKRKKSKLRLKQRVLGALLGLILFVGLSSVAVVVALRWMDPLCSAVMMLDWAERSLTQEAAAQLEYRWTPYDKIAPEFALAVIAAEDQLFPSHNGFDFEQIYDALEHRRRGGTLRGASTISQQVAKNLFLWKDRSFVRKGLEAYFTLLIESLWPKKRILEMYMNTAELGRGIFGVGAAAETYYGTRADKLNRAQAATLAAVLPNPVSYKVVKPGARVKRRKRWIEDQMRALGGMKYLSSL